ncbi:helix-turn-helix domain-containing protein [Agrococcus casei]|uniref:helix-turn-helix domain-containing protein n=1 Tax=Agrococcus casei TaxID=343512 RepID=UPI003F915310
MTQTSLTAIRDRIDITTLPPGVLLTEEELADILIISANTLRGYRQPGRSRGPNYLRTGGAIRYRVSDVVQWLDESAVAVA